MNKTATISMIIILSFLVSCGNSKKKKEEEKPLVLNEESVTLFGKQIESSLLALSTSIFNDAFDREYIRKKVSENSIVASSLDADFGRKYFDDNFHEGDLIVRQIEHGGDFKFVKYYFADGEHHVIFRTYSDFGIKIDDYTVHLVNNEIKIKDGYIYNMGTTFTNTILYDILYRILGKTDPEGATRYIGIADSLCRTGKYQQAFSLLEKQKEVLKPYPYYWYLYTMSIYHTDNKNFIANIDALQKEGFDERYRLVHQLLYYANHGNPGSLQQVIAGIEKHTGEDPIYLLFAGRATYYAGDYHAALTKYQEAEKGIAPLWDIWYGKLECYDKLNDTKNFFDVLNFAPETYGMNKKELSEMVTEDFPKMTKAKEFNLLKE